jgi:hypothetical protein
MEIGTSRSKKTFRTELGLETVECLPLALERVYDVQCGHSLPAGVLCVSHGVTDNILKEVPQNATDFFVDITADSLDAATTGETTDCRLRDTLNVFTHDFSMPLGATLSETFATFATTGHEK